MGPKWPQMVKNMLYWSFGIILDPLTPLWDLGKPAMFGHFWPQKGHFGPPCAHDWRMAMAKTASNQLGICLRIMHVQRIPKVSIFMAVTTKIVPEKAQKWPKMARFWPKWRYNGRVMAREIFFYQCLWVTKFFAKFGCSRIPRTATMHNSFIVLQCMWKEPAPLRGHLLGHYEFCIFWYFGHPLAVVANLSGVTKWVSIFSPLKSSKIISGEESQKE